MPVPGISEITFMFLHLSFNCKQSVSANLKAYLLIGTEGD